VFSFHLCRQQPVFRSSAKIKTGIPAAAFAVKLGYFMLFWDECGGLKLDLIGFELALFFGSSE
jgi:hypothetical protein